MMADTCDLMVASLRFSRLAICLLVRASLMSARTSSSRADRVTPKGRGEASFLLKEGGVVLPEPGEAG